MTKRITSAVNTLKFLSDRMTYIILRGRWCHIIVLNVHVPTRGKNDDVKHSFYAKLEHVFNKFAKSHMKILLGNFNAKVDRQDTLKPTTENESLHEISNNNGVSVVNFATSKNLTIKSTIFPHRTTSINILGCLQMGKPTTRLTIFWYTGKGI
jgi:exonuclease III